MAELNGLRLPAGVAVEELVEVAAQAAWGVIGGMLDAPPGDRRPNDLVLLAVRDALVSALEPPVRAADGSLLLRYRDARCDRERLCALIAYQVAVVAVPAVAEQTWDHQLADDLPDALLAVVAPLSAGSFPAHGSLRPFVTAGPGHEPAPPVLTPLRT